MATQLEQLLTCCICLDRFRNPKLLPCQHSVCMEPCMEGLVDYVRRQVKCPECRAEHRIPYNGVQGFPTNVTLQRFLEAHIEITGEIPDPFTGQIMERCGVCNEKNYLSICSHCEKKICVDCKSAHGEILKREIGRINNQVKRAIHRLSDQKIIIDRNMTALKNNSTSVTEEIDNICKRLIKSIRDRSDFLRNEVSNYYNTEHRNLTLMKEGLEQEITNVEANTDLADKHMDDQTSWDDCELMDAKDIFLRTVEFIRNFDYEGGDFNRRAKFNPPDDLNKLAVSLGSMGELVISGLKTGGAMDMYGNSSVMQSGLMKSKSDHRLAAQFRDQEEPSYGFNSGKTSPVPRRRFGDRLQVNHEESIYDPTNDTSRRRFRSRFMRREDEEDKDEEPQKTRPKVIDTEDASRGPLSGILKMYDSPRVIKRLQEKEMAPKKKKEEPPPKPVVASAPKPVTFGTPRKTLRQTSNDDEIDKIKKQNKVEATPSSTVTPKPTLERLTSLKDTERSNRVDRSSNSVHVEEDTSSRKRDYGNRHDTGSIRKTSTETPKLYPFSRSSSNSSVGENGRATTANSTTSKANETSHDSVMSRSNSTDSNKSSTDGVVPTSKKPSVSSYTKPAIKSTPPTSPPARTGASRYHNRFAVRPGTPAAETSKELTIEDEEEEESSEESETEESEESSEDEEEEKDTTPSYSLAGRRSSGTKTTPSANDSGYASSSSTSRYGSSNDSTTSYKRPSYLESSNKAKEKEDDFETKYPYASKFLNRAKTPAAPEEETKSAFQSRFLNKSKSSAVLGPDKQDNDDESPTTGSSRAKFEELKERRQKLARSKSSAGVDDDDTSTTTTQPTSSYRSRYSRDNDNATSTSASSSRLSNNNASSTSNDNAGEPNQLSNWAKYLKNKYGNKSSSSSSNANTSSASSATGTVAHNNDTSYGSSSTSSTPSSRSIARSRSSHLLGMAKDNTTSDDDSKNEGATPTSPAVGTLVDPTHIGNIHRSKYLQKQKLLFKIGSRGSEPKSFTWPRGIAVGPDNSIVVADSSNHRVQIFDSEGSFIKMFGSYGNGKGEFDCLAGVAVNRIGQYIIADRYNHRIQIFDPSGMFLRSFGSQGSGDGKFSYPWGVTTDSLGFIYVCDKENHRIQVFQSDGSFVGKFGSIGNKVGQLEHPHYIAVSSTNQVIVSDSNNHRIQVFDINGKVLTTFGSEGGDESQFKFPRGVAVDDQGYIFVADSGNNRIQIFNAEGSFIRAFGCWGSGDGEFKGLEGVSVMSNGNILICDRENHRVQVF